VGFCARLRRSCRRWAEVLQLALSPFTRSRRIARNQRGQITCAAGWDSSLAVPGRTIQLLLVCF